MFGHLLIAAFYVDASTTANPVCRALAAYHLVSDGSLRIDAHARWTKDKAKIGDGYYCDKAPLASFLVAAAYLPVSLATPQRMKARADLVPVLRVGALVCGVLPFVALLWITFLGAQRRGHAPSAALATCVAFYGSFLPVWSGTFFGHLLAAALLLGGYVLVFESRRYVAGGLCLGAAVLAEFPVALAVMFWAWHLGVRRRWPELTRLVLGGLPAALLLLAYNTALTGTPFEFAYSSTADPKFRQMRQALGFSLPDPSAAWELLFGQYRGLFFYAPVLWALAAIALPALVREPRRVLHPAVLAVLGGWVLVSSYFVWTGGTSYGPRHLIPFVAPALYEGAQLLARDTRRLWLAALPAAAGLWMSSVALGTHVYRLRTNWEKPFWDVLVPTWSQGPINRHNLATSVFGASPETAAVAWWVLVVLVIGGQGYLWHRIVAAHESSPGRSS